MLVLSRKIGESILINKDIQITIAEIHGNRVKIGVQASLEVSVLRSEIAPLDWTAAGAVVAPVACEIC
jgi:carbon storage regulator